jgi:hypothetical protein
MQLSNHTETYTHTHMKMCINPYLYPQGPYGVVLYSMFLLSLNRAPGLSRNTPWDAGFICDKSVVLGPAVKCPWEVRYTLYSINSTSEGV